MSKLRQVLATADRATLGTIVAGMLAQLGLVVSGIIAARALGPSDRGYLAAFQAIAVAGSFILALGVPVAIAYYVAHDERIARGSVHHAAQDHRAPAVRGDPDPGGGLPDRRSPTTRRTPRRPPGSRCR